MRRINILFILILLIQINIFCNTDNVQSSSKKSILSTEKIWQINYDNYIPDKELLNKLNGKIKNELKIDIYLALWCGDSENNVPEFIKILDKLSKKIEVNYFLCQRKKNKNIKYYVEDKKIERVPTFIFLRNNVEIGRIIENPEKSLLEDFLKIVFDK